MATISEQLKYILTLDASQATKSFQQVGATADKELSKADAKLDKLGATFTKVGAGAVAFAGIAGAGLVKLTMGASNLAESVNAVNVTFGDAAQEILELGENAAKAVGLSKAEFNGLAVQFSSFAEVVAGKGGDVVGTMDQLTTRVADFASVMNLDVPEAARIFQSALAGETEPIKKFGIDLSAASVAAHAVETGIIAAGDAMTAAQKTQATYSLLMEATNKTAGDFANTSDGLANQQRILKAELKNLSDDIGAGILPMLTSVVSVAGKVIGAFSELSPETKAMAGQFAAIGVTGVGLIGTLSLVAGQVIKMRDRFVDSTGSLTAFGKAAKGVGIAMGVLAIAAAAYSVYASEKAKATARTEEFVAALKAETGGQEDATAAVLAARFAHEDYQAVMADTELTAADLAAFIRGDMTSAMQAYVDSIDAATPGGQLFIGALESQRDSLTEAERKVAAEAAALKDLAPTTDKAVDATEDLTGATDELTEATGYGTLAQEEHATATDNWKMANEAATEADKEAADAAKAHTDAINAQVEALTALVGGDIAVRDAQREAAAAVAELTVAMDAGELSAEELAAQTDATATELIDAATAAADYDEKLGNANGVVLDAQGKNDLLKQKLEELAATLAPGSALRQQIQGYIDDLNRIPESRETRVFITGSGATGPHQGPIRGTLAAGGPVQAGSAYVVGEQGPEVFVPSSSGTVVANGGNGHSGLGAAPISITVNAGMGANGQEIGDIIVSELKKYSRRNGPGWVPS